MEKVKLHLYSSPISEMLADAGQTNKAERVLMVSVMLNAASVLIERRFGET
jgi:hypothetical protein